MELNTVSQNFAAFNAAGTILTNGLGGGFDCSEDFTVTSTCSYSTSGTGSVGSSICTCFQGLGTGIGVSTACPIHGTLTVPAPGTTFIPATSPNWTISWPPTPQVDPLCYICREEVDSKDLLAGHKTCRDCRVAVETFKQVLIHEEKDE